MRAVIFHNFQAWGKKQQWTTKRRKGCTLVWLFISKSKLRALTCLFMYTVRMIIIWSINGCCLSTKVQIYLWFVKEKNPSRSQIEEYPFFLRQNIHTKWQILERLLDYNGTNTNLSTWAIDLWYISWLMFAIFSR